MSLCEEYHDAPLTARVRTWPWNLDKAWKFEKYPQGLEKLGIFLKKFYFFEKPGIFLKKAVLVCMDLAYAVVRIDSQPSDSKVESAVGMLHVWHVSYQGPVRGFIATYIMIYGRNLRSWK